MGTYAMSISEFMARDYKIPKVKKAWKKKAKKIGTSIAVPLVLANPVLAATPEAIPVGATQYIGAKTLETIAHALDPLVELMVALSFPIASVVMLGACFFFMFGQSDKAWAGIMQGGLGYVLIQIMPLLLNILKQVGNAI